jgi:hypothetical protein
MTSPGRPEDSDKKETKGLSVNELQGWAQNNLGRIWLVVVLVLATLSAVAFWNPSISLIFLTLGLIAGTLQSDLGMSLISKGLKALEGLAGTTRIVALAVVAVVLIFLPFLLTLCVGVIAGAHLMNGLGLMQLLKGSKN